MCDAGKGLTVSFSESEREALRKHIDEAKNDPDYDVIGESVRQQELERQNFTAFKP